MLMFDKCDSNAFITFQSLPMQTALYFIFFKMKKKEEKRMGFGCYRFSFLLISKSSMKANKEIDCNK